MIRSAMAMGSDLFEPVDHFEEQAEAEQAEEGEEQGGHGVLFCHAPLEPCATTRPERIQRLPIKASVMPTDPHAIMSTLPKWKGAVQEWKGLARLPHAGQAYLCMGLHRYASAVFTCTGGAVPAEGEAESGFGKPVELLMDLMIG